MKTALVVYRCPHGRLSVCVEITETGSGVRVIGQKCCPAQYALTLARFEPTKKEWQALAEEAENAVEG